MKKYKITIITRTVRYPSQAAHTSFSYEINENDNIDFTDDYGNLKFKCADGRWIMINANDWIHIEVYAINS